MLWDTHMHCHFSGDSDTAPEDMIKASIEKGLNGICFTDHLDYDYKEHPGMFDLDVDSYYKEIISLNNTLIFIRKWMICRLRNIIQEPKSQTV